MPVIADRTADEFEVAIARILNFPEPGSFADALMDFLPGDNGMLWGKKPSLMTPADAFEYLARRFGVLRAKSARARFTVH